MINIYGNMEGTILLDLTVVILLHHYAPYLTLISFSINLCTRWKYR